jgi:CubicO group peptidase (beta-lactamase class C family)
VAPAPVAVAPVPAAAPPVADPRAELEAKVDAIFAAFARPGAVGPGCAVGVYRAGEIAFSKGYGYADVEHGAPMTDETPVYTASLSKQFTAAAVLLLVADGKVSLEDDVRKYVPELHDFGTRVTIEQLLHHTSGLRDYHLLLQLQGLNEEDVLTRTEVLWLLAHQKSLAFAPGSRFSYSSSGYVLLAEIVRRVSGESLHAFLSRRVFGPLGMSRTHVREDHARPVAGRATGYTRGPDGELRQLMGNIEYDGSSNLVSTVRDLARWDANFYDPKVGGPALVDAMRVRGKLSDGTALDYAAGLEETDLHGAHAELHDGGFMGYRTYLLRYPDERMSVSVLCNTTEADADGLGDAVAQVFLPQPVAGQSSPSAARQAAVVEPPPAPFGHDLPALAGTYVEPWTAETRVLEVAGGVVRMRVGRASPRARELVPAGPGDLLVKGGRTHYRYEPGAGARPAQLVRTAGHDTPRTFVRVDPVTKVDDLAQYAGRYGSDELARDLEIRVEDGHLVDGPVAGAALLDPLVPVARDLFATEDAGWRFERDARGHVVRLVASTDRSPRVVLQRR